jgi:hypothetical protein
MRSLLEDISAKMAEQSRFSSSDGKLAGWGGSPSKVKISRLGVSNPTTERTQHQRTRQLGVGAVD